MTPLEQQFVEDRQIRDAAWTVLKADVDLARASFSAKGIAERVGDRIGDGAKDVFETAKEQAEDNRGVIAALIGAVILWFAREPLAELLGLAPHDNEDADHDPPTDPETHDTDPRAAGHAANPAPGDYDE